MSEVDVLIQDNVTVEVLVTDSIFVEVSTAQPGPQGPPGINGLLAEDIAPLVSHKHTQATQSSTWTIYHTLGFYPNVTVLDSAKTNIECEVKYNDISTVVLEFSTPISGEAYLT